MPAIRDGDWTLFSYDAATGRTVWHLRLEDGRDVFREETPVSAVLDANAEAEIASHGRAFGDWNRAASIPLTTFHASGFDAALKQQDRAWMKRFLNDADNAKFRTSRGRV